MAGADSPLASLTHGNLGALWVTQAALPIMRAQGAGHIIQVSSIGGVAAFANIGMYHASKWSAAVKIANAVYAQKLATWKQWESVSIAADKP